MVRHAIKIVSPIIAKDDKNLGRTFYGVVGCGIGGHLNPKKAPEGQRIVTSTRSHSTGRQILRYIFIRFT